ncbi:hypothetical protein IWX90DRAFT_412523 [Phyllosticta citrichinensis]|uniref:Uncharacterized protein n=1 Tax=Phyllosticta citrichinensis TaxID=1130410 RepID=A0ABR1Y4E7_9PEZI
MRFSLVLSTLFLTSTVQAQFILGTIFAIELIIDFVTTVGAEEAVVGELTSASEILMTEGEGAAAGELSFAPYNVGNSATVMSGEYGETFVAGAESANFFTIAERSFTQAGGTSGKKILSADITWNGFNFNQRSGARFWIPSATGTLKAGFNELGGKLVTDGGATVIRRSAEAGTRVVYGSARPVGGYKMRIKDFQVRPRPLTDT